MNFEKKKKRPSLYTIKKIMKFDKNKFSRSCEDKALCDVKRLMKSHVITYLVCER